MPSSSEINQTLAQQIEAARVGDSVALGELLELYRNYLLLTANRELESELQAKVAPSDVVQKTFLEACRDFQQFRGGSEAEILGWLKGILQHNLANVRREYRQASMRQINREQPLNPDADEHAVDKLTPGTALASEEQKQMVVQAINQLPELYRNVLLMRQQEDCSFPEIGERLGRSADSARKLWCRAVEQLKGIFKTQTILR